MDFRSKRLRAAAAALLGMALLVPAAAAQQVRSVRQLQVGLAAVPGVGVQAGYVSLRSLYTVEGMLYVDASPQFDGGEGSVQLSGGVGVALRPLGIARTIGNAPYQGYDLFLGTRFGPGLFFPYGTSSRGENPFSLFLEPFVRLTRDGAGGRTLYIELGTQRPLLRAGLWFGL